MTTIRTAPLSATNVSSIPERADHWKKLDIAQISTKPAAFLSVSQSISLCLPGDNELNEKARQTAFIGTDLPLDVNGLGPLGVVPGAARQSSTCSSGHCR